MLDMPDEIAALVDHEAETYTNTFSTLIDLARINNRLKLHELASLLNIKPRTITEWRAGRKLPHSTKHIAIVTLLARGILQAEDGQLAINPNPPTSTINTPNPFNPTNHLEIQKIIAAKSRPTIKDRLGEVNNAIPELTLMLNNLNTELGPQLKTTLQALKEAASGLNLSPDQAMSFFAKLFQMGQQEK